MNDLTDYKLEVYKAKNTVLEYFDIFIYTNDKEPVYKLESYSNIRFYINETLLRRSDLWSIFTKDCLVPKNYSSSNNYELLKEQRKLKFLIFIFNDLKDRRFSLEKQGRSLNLLPTSKFLFLIDVLEHFLNKELFSL